MPSEGRESTSKLKIPGTLPALILGAVIVLQLLFIAYTNLFATVDVLDNDMAKLFVHVAHMWEQKSLFIPGWAYDTTLELDCPALLAIPLYGITGNIFVSIGISNIIFTLIFVFVCHEMLHAAGFGVIPERLAIIAVLTPYSFGQLLYYDMLFFGGAYYCMKVMVPLLAIRLLLTDEAWDLKSKICAGLLVFFSFLTGLSSGAYVYVAGLLPIFAVYVLMKGIKERNKILQIGVYTAVSALGMVITKLMHLVTDGPEYRLLSFEELKDSFESLMICFIEMMGMLTDYRTKLFSARGIECMLKSLLTLAILAFLIAYAVRAWRAFRRSGEKAGTPGEGISKRDMLSLFVMGLVVADIFIVLLTGLSNGARYLLLSFVPLLLVFAAILAEKLTAWNKSAVGFAVSAAFIILTILSDSTVLRGDPFPFMRDDHYKYDGLLETLKKYPGRDVIFLDDVNTAEILRARDLRGGREYVTYVSEGSEYFEPGIMAYDYYLSVREDGAIGEDHILVINDLYTGVDVVPDEPIFADYKELDTFQVYRLYTK